MEYVKRKLSELHPYENNPRINDDAVDDVQESIRQVGYISPIIVDDDGVILAGHTRYKALKRLGRKEVDVLLVSGLTEEQKRKYRLYDNKTAEFSKWDTRKLLEELGQVDLEGYDFGFPSAKDQEGKTEDGKIKKVCPCCGEVFEV